MRRLLVLYDSACPFCGWCRAWLEARPTLVPLEFLCCRSELAASRYGRIEGLGRELVVVAEDGRYWVGPSAFAMCFWALEDWRDVADAVTAGGIWWLTRRIFGLISDHRAQLGRVLGVPCHEGHCAAGAAAAIGPYR